MVKSFKKFSFKMSKFLDFIEIGTSDFDTEIEKANDDTYGISVEPVKFYLEKLPNKKNVQKLNLAISNENGECLIYYMSQDNIISYNFPDWVRGCSSINTYHKTVSAEIQRRGLDIEKLIDTYNVEKKTLNTLI